MIVPRLLPLAVLLVSSMAAQAEGLTVATAPAVVVKTAPEPGAIGVDPGLKEIAVTFSKEMKDGSWSWGMIDQASFPETAGAPHYQGDKRTAVLPVHLKPGATYAIWVNTARLTNFKDAAGTPAVPYLLVFETRK